MALDDAKNILNDSEQPINKGFYRIDRTNEELLDAADFVSTDVTRFNLTGVFVDSGIWATDGHRAKITNPIPADDKTGNAVIIPANIIKWFGKLNAEFFASMDDMQILTTVERVDIICDSIEGPYPNIRAVIPTLFDNEIHINSRDFKKLDAFLERAKKLVKRTHKFAFIVCSNYIKVNAVDIDSGLEISETLDNSYITGESPVNIGFDAAYAQQIERKIIKQDKNAVSFIIKYNTAISATLWNDNYLLMPVRLVED
jgi:DNA polymerase III sliding clamp (beta) subunit (PCNA family)